MDKLMKLNVQMFAETADNATDEIVVDEIIDTPVDTDNADGEIEEIDAVETPSAEIDEINSKKAETKAFSERLNRKAEEIRLAEEAKQKSKLDSLAKTRGFDSWEELEEYSENERIERLGVTDNEGFKSLVEEMVSKNPIVQRANEILARQDEERQAEYVKREMSEITRLDSDVKTLDDLTKLDKYDELAERIKKGYGLLEAYKLTYFDKIKNKEVESTKQKVLNNIDSKSHLKTTSGSTGNDIHVPQDILAIYKKNMPKMSDEAIRKHYSNSMKGE